MTNARKKFFKHLLFAIIGVMIMVTSLTILIVGTAKLTPVLIGLTLIGAISGSVILEESTRAIRKLGEIND